MRIPTHAIYSRAPRGRRGAATLKQMDYADVPESKALGTLAAAGMDAAMTAGDMAAAQTIAAAAQRAERAGALTP